MKKLDILQRTGAALGIIEDFKMEERTINLGNGDTLLFYTDGLTEAFSPTDETFGDERVQAVIHSANGQTARVLLDQLKEAVFQFMEPLPPADDITMLALRRTK
jgi:sigma-B regulation protein RsbU (phosphoserine phosphatase)